MKTVLDYKKIYGNKWAFLESVGWQIKPTNNSRGTAHCDRNEKTIFVKGSAFYKPSIRIIKYVMPHEIWHAVHAELLNYECEDLQNNRNLRWSSAVEAVADGGVLFDNPSKLMRSWVRASILWHRKVSYKYSWSDVVAKETTDLLKLMNLLITQKGY